MTLLASFFNNQILFKFFNIINNFLISLQFRQLLIIPSNNYYTRLEQIDIPNTPPNTLLPREKEGASQNVAIYTINSIQKSTFTYSRLVKTSLKTLQNNTPPLQAKRLIPIDRPLSESRRKNHRERSILACINPSSSCNHRATSTLRRLFTITREGREGAGSKKGEEDVEDGETKRSCVTRPCSWHKPRN